MLSPINALPRSSSRSPIHEATSPVRNDHRIGSVNRDSRLGPDAVFGFTEELLHQVDTIVGYFRSRRESKGCLPIENLLSSDMPLLQENTMSSNENTKGGLTYRVADERRIATSEGMGYWVRLLRDGYHVPV